MTAQKDNSTFRQKVALRYELLEEMPGPHVVLETHGVYGKIWEQCYSHLPEGVVFEKNPEKSAILALQRPTWAVYEADCQVGIFGKVGSHLPVNFLDIDPYGDPWPIITTFFLCWPNFPDTLGIVVQDGLRQKLMMNGGWHVKSISSLVLRHGNDKLYRYYKELCQELLTQTVARVGYRLEKWTAYYCGKNNTNTHYAALLRK